MKLWLALYSMLLFASQAQAQLGAVAESVQARQDVPLETNPAAAFWRDARPIFAEVDVTGKPLPEYRTEIRSRWTTHNIYFLFVCPYQNLYLKPAPDVVHETYELWNWNVAEVFIGSDFADIQRYKEFEVSPHNEWIDLDVDLHKPHHEEGWVWNSGFEHLTHIDERNHVWYAAVRIPFSAISSHPLSSGNSFRVNFYRTEGPPQTSKEIMWQPVMGSTFHAPERFGLLRLVTP